MKTVVIYHRADFDGIFCYQIAKKFLGSNAEYIGWDYGDPKIIWPTEGVDFILDLSPECLEREKQVCGVVWIDHHKSAIDKFDPSIEGYRIDGVAACRLSWQWFSKHQMLFHPTAGSFSIPLPQKQEFIERIVSEPLAVRLAGEYDIWDKRDPRAELFQHGLRSQDLTDFWKNMLDVRDYEMVNILLTAGESIQYNSIQQNESIIKEIGFTIEFEGLKFLACNHARYNSFLFTAGLKPEHDGCFGFKYDGQKQQWSISLYHAPGKEHHDLSLIASKYGGGGHRGACGFRLKHLPFT